jgi:hypothetical protein
MGLTKRELVEYVRMAEHNQEVAEETLKQQAENVKDWMPVVRCKDCKHYMPYPLNKEDKRMCCYVHSLMQEDGFCSYGERREGE